MPICILVLATPFEACTKRRSRLTTHLQGDVLPARHSHRAFAQDHLPPGLCNKKLPASSLYDIWHANASELTQICIDPRATPFRLFGLDDSISTTIS